MGKMFMIMGIVILAILLMAVGAVIMDEQEDEWMDAFIDTEEKEDE